MITKEHFDNIVNQLMQLDEAEREKLVGIIERRQRTISRMRHYKEREEELKQDLFSIRSSCDHPARTTKKIYYEDDYGKLLSGGYIESICPDCGWRNTTKFEDV